MYKNHLHNTYIYYLSPDSCQRCMISVMRGLARFFIVPGSREARENLKMIHHSLWPEVYSQSSLPMIDPNHFSIGSSTFPYAWRQQTCRSKEKNVLIKIWTNLGERQKHKGQEAPMHEICKDLSPSSQCDLSTHQVRVGLSRRSSSYAE